MRVGTKGLLLVSIPLLFGLVTVGALRVLLEKAHIAQMKAAHSRAVVVAADALLDDITKSATCLFGYSISNDTFYLDRFDRSKARIEPDQAKLEGLLHDDTKKAELIRRVGLLSRRLGHIFEEIKYKINDGDERTLFWSNGELRLKVETLATDLNRQLALLTESERQADLTSAASQEEWQLVIDRSLVLVLVSSALLTVLMAIYLSKSITRRLSVLSRNAKLLAEGKPLLEEQPGRDEIAELDRVFHHMALQLAEASKKERAIVADALDAIFTLDEKLVFVRANPATCRLLSLSEAELSSLSFDSLVFPGELERLTQWIGAVRRAGSQQPIEVRVFPPDGSVCHVLLSAFWSDEQGAYFCVAHDITEQKQIENLRQRFVSMIGHDLRTPLTSIQLALQMVIEGIYGDISDDAGDRLSSAVRNVDQLITLTNQLIELEKRGIDSIALSIECVDLQSLLEDAVDTVLGLAASRNIRLVLSTGRYFVSADRTRLLQVIVNLISNATKFSNHDAEIRITAEAHGGMVEIKVIDTGRGIPTDALDRIFDRFEQVEESDATEKGGAGLGLSICKSLVEEQGGTIGAVSEYGKGSTFWIRLPLVEANVPALDGVQE